MKDYLNNTYSSCLFLKHVNNLRFDYIKKNLDCNDNFILDIGCGPGFLSKKFSNFDFNIVSVDKSISLINIAKSINFSNNIKYICSDFDKFSNDNNIFYDVILCMEILEHLYDINRFIFNLKKISNSNTKIFISSLDRNIMSYLKIVFLGEYFFKKLEKGTHLYNNFKELNDLNKILLENKFFIEDIKFINYNPITELCCLNSIYNYNYICKISLC